MASWDSFQDFKRMLNRPLPENRESSEESGVEAETEGSSHGPTDEQEHSSVKAEITDDGEATEASESPSIPELKDPPRLFLEESDAEDYLIIPAENTEMRDLVEEICTQMNVWSSATISPGGTLEIPVRRIYLIRHQLQSRLLSHLSADLNKDIEALLGLIFSRSRALRSSGLPENLFARCISAQKAALTRGCVRFEELIDVFLPGELIYVEYSGRSPMFTFGQCWKVCCCTYKMTRSQERLIICGLQWSWDASEFRFALANAELVVERYDGEKQISLEDLGLVPLACLEGTKRDALVERLISRGKRYVSLFESPGKVWQYKGPARTPTSTGLLFTSRTILGPGEEDAQRRRMRGNSVIDSRVIVDATIPQRDPDRIEILQVMQKADSIHTDTYMTLPVYVWVQVLPGVRHECTAVYLDFLREVSWEEPSSENITTPMCSRISSVIKDFDAWARMPTRYRRASVGQIIILRGNLLDTTAVANDAAEACQRGLLELDYFDCKPSRRIFNHISFHMNLALKVNGIILLQNFAPLVSKRSHESLGHSYEITDFIELLEVFPGVICLCLGNEDSVDPKLEKLGPMHFDISQE